MKAAHIILVAALVGCGEPTPLPCTDYGVGVCAASGTCVDGWCANEDGACASGYRYDESAGSLGGTCTNAGNGSGGSGAGGDGGMVVKDEPHPLVLGESGNTINARGAVDDIDVPCVTTAGGVDVMFDVLIDATNPRLYVDTYETEYDVVLAIYEGPCTALPVNAVACVSSAGIGACGPRTKQFSKNLRPGPHCVIVDQPASGPPHDTLHVRAMVGPSATTVAGTGTFGSSTCTGNKFQPDAVCNGIPNYDDYAWFFMACGGHWLFATTPSGWPGALEGRTLRSPAVDCYDGTAGLDFNMAAEPAPMWIIAHDLSSTCGTVQLAIGPF